MYVTYLKKNEIILMYEMFIGLGNDNVRAYPNNIIVSSLEEFMNMLSQELLWIEAKDIWYVFISIYQF